MSGQSRRLRAEQQADTKIQQRLERAITERHSDTMYTNPNFTTKKALKEAVAKGEPVTVFAPGLGEPPVNGCTSVEGPHYPKPHTWYAQVEVTNGLVTKVS